MDKNQVAHSLRAKKLGVLIRDARSTARRDVAECAARLGITPQEYEAFEYGDSAPSLPQLESLAFIFDIPLEHFWEDRLVTSSLRQKNKLDLPQVIQLRHRIIGARLRKARLEAGLSLEELAQLTDEITASELEAFELGDAVIPLPMLEELVSLLDRSMKEFLDRQGPIGAWASQQRSIQGFLELSPELQAFVSNPSNRPYLDIAYRLSELPVNRLRLVAEGLLEITY